MQFSNVLIHCRRRLGATIAIRVAKIQRADAVLAQSALECGAAVDRLGCVISHASIVAVLPDRTSGQ
jgi:hypothetical protein